MNVLFLCARSLSKRRSIRRALRLNYDGVVEKGVDDVVGCCYGGIEIVVVVFVYLVVDFEFGGCYCYDATWILY